MKTAPEWRNARKFAPLYLHRTAVPNNGTPPRFPDLMADIPVEPGEIEDLMHAPKPR
jgi:hypothetical protein